MPIFHNQLKLYSYLVWAFFLSVVVSVVLSNNPHDGINRIGSNIHFLVAPFVAYGIHKSGITLKQIVSMIKLSIVIGTIFAIYQFHYLGFTRSEAGADSPTIFGFIMVIFAFFSIVNIWKEHTADKLFLLLVFLLATYSIILSGTRIAYLMFVVLVPVIILLWATTNQLTKKTLPYIFITLLAIVMFATHNKQINHRIVDAFNEVQSFHNNQEANKSVDLRLEMWRSGFDAFKQKPIIGYGYQNTGVAASRYVNGNYAKSFISGMKILHNDYINSMVGFGIIGLFVLLSLLFVPLILFFQRAKNSDNFITNSMGVILIIGMATFSITDSIYSHNVMRTFVIFFMALLLCESKSKHHQERDL